MCGRLLIIVIFERIEQMAKEFNYKDGNEVYRIANEIIDLLNEYDLEEVYIRSILNKVVDSFESSKEWARVQITKVY